MSNNTMLSPPQTQISINSSPATPQHFRKGTSKRQRMTASSSLLNSTTTIIDTVLNRFRGDVVALIAEKDETINILFHQCDAERQAILKAENCHLQEKADLLETSGFEIARSTAKILELRLQVRKLSAEKAGLEDTLLAESFQLKKDILDLRGEKVDLEGRLKDSRREKDEERKEFEEKLKLKGGVLEQAGLEVSLNKGVLLAKDREIENLTKAAGELDAKNSGLVDEIAGLKEELRGVKRTWEDFREYFIHIDMKLGAEDPPVVKKPIVEEG